MYTGLACSAVRHFFDDAWCTEINVTPMRPFTLHAVLLEKERSEEARARAHEIKLSVSSRVGRQYKLNAPGCKENGFHWQFFRGLEIGCFLWNWFMTQVSS